MPTPTTRPATLDDLEPILDMMVAFNVHEEIPFDRARGLDAARVLLEDPGLGTIGVVESNGAPVGYYILTWGYDLEWNGRDAFLTELWIEPAHRARGFGRAALGRLEAVAQAAGARALHLMVRHENQAALRLYLDVGFEDPKRLLLTKKL